MKKFDCKNGSAPEINLSWLYYGEVKIRETFVYEYTPTRHMAISIRQNSGFSSDGKFQSTEGETSDGKMSDGKTWTSDGKLQMAKADSVYQRTDPDSVVAKTEDWRTF